MPNGNEEIKGKILEALSKHPEGLTITDAAKILDLNYMTISKYLAILEAEGKISCRSIGMAKLFTVQERGVK